MIAQNGFFFKKIEVIKIKLLSRRLSSKDLFCDVVKVSAGNGSALFQGVSIY